MRSWHMQGELISHQATAPGPTSCLESSVCRLEVYALGRVHHGKEPVMHRCSTSRCSQPSRFSKVCVCDVAGGERWGVD